MTQKTLDRSEINRRLVEIDKIFALDLDTVAIEKLPALIQEKHSAAGERDRLLVVLKEVDKREAADAERDRVLAIQQEIAQLTVESNAFQASLPDLAKRVEALAIVFAELLLKLQTDGRRANFAKSRVFLLQKQLQGGQIERFDSIPTALHMPETITISILVADPRPGIEFHTGTPWVVEATTIEQVLEGKSLGDVE